MPDENNDDDTFNYFDNKPRSKSKKCLVEKGDFFTFFESKPTHDDINNISNSKPAFINFENCEISEPLENLEKTCHFETQDIKSELSDDKLPFINIKNCETTELSKNLERIEPIPNNNNKISKNKPSFTIYKTKEIPLSSNKQNANLESNPNDVPNVFITQNLKNTLTIKLNEFLNSKKTEILEGKFIPSLKKILFECEELKYYKSVSQEVQRWLVLNTPFKNLTELKKKFFGTPMHEKLKDFLNSKKADIIKGKFIPTKENIVAERNEFEGYHLLTYIVRTWIKNNTNFRDISNLKREFNGIPLSEQLKNLLNSKKKDILDGKFIPTRKRIISEKKEFKDYKNLTSTIIRWLRDNTSFKSLTDLKEKVHGDPIRNQIRSLLDSHQNEILNGRYFPTKKNLRKVNEAFGNYKNAHIVVSEWLNEKSNGIFINLINLIDHFKPSKTSLGLAGRHGYNPKFEQEKYRVKIAWNQTIRLIDNDRIIQIAQKNQPATWNGLFNYMKKNQEWHFIDLLTGEIINIDDQLLSKIDFHHIDGNKKNDDESNLCYILHPNHGLITMSQFNHSTLARFFEVLLKDNLISIKKGIIPECWKKGWRIIAEKEGINLSPNKYKRKVKSNKKIIEINTHTKDIGEWLRK